MRVVLDTNVLVAAFATRGLCADVLRTVLAQHELLVSKTILDELSRALSLKVRVPASVIRGVVAFLRASASLVPAAASPSPITVRDPDDAVVLAEALAGGADVLVTGDRDLLDLGAGSPVRILDPRGFWELERAQGRARHED